MKAGIEKNAGWIARNSSGELVAGSPETSIHCISSDSRDPGEEGLFIALRGERFDGHDYAADLMKSGKIRALLVMKHGFEEAAVKTGTVLIRCGDTLSALGSLGRARRDEIDPLMTGVTGTNGKTTSKEMLSSVLGSVDKCHKNIRNYNNEIGVPFTLLELEPAHRYAVIEMGMNHPGEISRLSGIVKPDIALITNIGEGHLEFLGNVENVAAAKSEIMDGMEKGAVVVANMDSSCYGIVRDRAVKRGLDIVSFGLSAGADFHPENYRLENGRISMLLRGVRFDVPLYGLHNLYNILGVSAAASAAGVEAERTAAVLSEFSGVSGRSELIEMGCTLINDTYNSNPQSASFALRSLSVVFGGRRKIAILGEMKELGPSSARYHRLIGAEAAVNGIELLLLWGEMAGMYREGALEAGMPGSGVKIFADREELSEFAVANIRKGDVVLVKGSRSTAMEHVAGRIMESGVR